jgi:hypothetical protein
MDGPKKNSCRKCTNGAKDTATEEDICSPLNYYTMPIQIKMNNGTNETKDICKRCSHSFVDVDMSCGCQYHVVSVFPTYE